MSSSSELALPDGNTVMKGAEVEAFEKLVGQLDGLYEELGGLARKTPNGPISAFKLRFVNKVIEAANLVLGGEYRPFADFDLFDDQDLPTASDVTLLLSQYLECAETMRANNLVRWNGPNWIWRLDDDPHDKNVIRSGPPKKVTKK